eukprot:TRINITY_DN7772_c0_g4_i2.p1 TRINITY_DN7772_c0_g4~~TRINITY_DN7772_c0_g4_i2.p1  ORF type:complete len:699 (+),score=165.27 TRINITY_DN7772_c0_g4_i2:47-2143(+)
MDSRARRRVGIISRHVADTTVDYQHAPLVEGLPCFKYSTPEAGEDVFSFDPHAVRVSLDGDYMQTMDEMFRVFASNPIFWPQGRRQQQSGPLYVGMDYNSTKEEQRAVTFERILFLRDRGYFKGWLTNDDPTVVKQMAAMHEAIGIYDHSMGIKLGVHIHLWGAAVKYLGTKRHHEKWLQQTEDYVVAGCFALTELGHGSNVRGIETVATYDPRTREFIISTPCETAQKYWIGGAAQHATHMVCFANLHINGRSEGVHAFVVQLRDSHGRVCQGVRIADCGHKIGLNGVDNGRIWFDDVRVPRENLLNAVADVTEAGEYKSRISDPDQRFAALMTPLTGGRVTIAAGAINQCKTGLTIALRYALTRRAFSLSSGGEEVCLLDYPGHQRRLLPLLAKTYVYNFGCNLLKEAYIRRQPSDAKVIHVSSSGYKALCSWHMLRTLQECREACGGQGVASSNRIAQLRAEHDVMATFEGDNNVLMQTVSKSLLADYWQAQKKGQPLQGLGLEHINSPSAVVPPVLTSISLRSESFLLDIFRLRERDLLEKFVAEVGACLKEGKAMAVALNESYQLGGDLGRAHTERHALEAALVTVAALPKGTCKDVLMLLIALASLSTIDEDPVFLRYGHLRAEQAQAVQREVARLCSDVRPHVLALVSALGRPQHLLGPIAFDWVEANSWDVASTAANDGALAAAAADGFH